jgi:hypothetical protein
LPRRTSTQVAAARARSVLLTLLGFAVALALPAASSSLSGTSGVCPSPSGQELVQRVRMPGQPRFLLLTREALWVTIAASRPSGRGMLARIDPRSGQIQRTFPLPVDPSRVGFGFGSLWITGESNTDRYRFPVLRVDPRSGRVVSVIRGPRLFGVALGITSDAVWVGGNDIAPQGKGDQTLMRWIFKIDPGKNTVVHSVHLKPTTAIELVGDQHSLWATGWGGVARLSDSGRLLFQQRFNGSGWSLALTPGAVWIAQPFFGNRDPRSQRPARRILRIATSGPRHVEVLALDVPPGKVSAAAGVVWVGPAIWSNGELTRIDATRTPPTLTSVAGVVANRLQAFPGGVWVAERDANVLAKIC